MEANATYRVIISGGGTGGHIYPALAIAQEFQKRHSESKLLFVGARGRMEMEKVPQEGFEIIGLNIAGIQRRLTLENLKFPFRLISSIWKAGKVIKSFKPDVAIGVGGYASGPLLYMASMMGIPTLIQEQNAFAGLTNKLLAKRVDKVCIAVEEAGQYFAKDKTVLTGNPVRSDILDLENKRERALAHFELDPNRKTVLVLGGSLGARTINESVLNALDEIAEANVQVLWQVGKLYYEEMVGRLKALKPQQVFPLAFIKEMDLAYAAADVVISRAGALSVSELCLVRKPVVFVPSPNVAEDHQTKNAQALVNHGAALMVPDHEAKERMMAMAIGLLKEEDKCKRLADNIGALGKPDATATIVNEIEKLIIK